MYTASEAESRKLKKLSALSSIVEESETSDNSSGLGSVWVVPGAMNQVPVIQGTETLVKLSQLSAILEEAETSDRGSSVESFSQNSPSNRSFDSGKDDRCPGDRYREDSFIDDSFEDDSNRYKSGADDLHGVSSMTDDTVTSGCQRYNSHVEVTDSLKNNNSNSHNIHVDDISDKNQDEDQSYSDLIPLDSSNGSYIDDPIDGFKEICKNKLFRDSSFCSNYENINRNPSSASNTSSVFKRKMEYYHQKSGKYQIAFDIPIDDTDTDTIEYPGVTGAQGDVWSEIKSDANDQPHHYELVNVTSSDKLNDKPKGTKDQSVNSNILTSIKDSSSRIIDDLGESKCRTCEIGVQAIPYGKKKTKTSSTQSSRQPSSRKTRKKVDKLSDDKIAKLKDEWRSKRHGLQDKGTFKYI